MNKRKIRNDKENIIDPTTEIYFVRKVYDNLESPTNGPRVIKKNKYIDSFTCEESLDNRV